jgi:hypothetical protein
MEYKDLLSVYFERTNAANGLWGFYITVVFGLLAYFGTAARSQQKTLLAVIVSLGFLGFAYVNKAAILETAKARYATANLMSHYRDPANQAAIDDLNKTIHPVSVRGIDYFHIGSDIMVLIGLWMLTL